MSSEDQSQFSSDPEQIAAQLESTRAELGRTVDELADRLSPKKQLDAAKVQLQEGANRALASVKQTANAAGAGDQEALTKVGMVAGGTVLALGLLVWRVSRRKEK